MNTNQEIKNNVRIDISRNQAEKILDGKCVWKNIGNTTYSIKVGTTAENMKHELKILQGQVYNYRAESKKLREFVAAKGYNPSDIHNTSMDKLKSLKTKKDKKKK